MYSFWNNILHKNNNWIGPEFLKMLLDAQICWILYVGAHLFIGFAEKDAFIMDKKRDVSNSIPNISKTVEFCCQKSKKAILTP